MRDVDEAGTGGQRRGEPVGDVNPGQGVDRSTKQRLVDPGFLEVLILGVVAAAIWDGVKHVSQAVLERRHTGQSEPNQKQDRLLAELDSVAARLDGLVGDFDGALTGGDQHGLDLYLRPADTARFANAVRDGASLLDKAERYAQTARAMADDEIAGSLRDNSVPIPQELFELQQRLGKVTQLWGQGAPGLELLAELRSIVLGIRAQVRQMRDGS